MNNSEWVTSTLESLEGRYVEVEGTDIYGKLQEIDLDGIQLFCIGEARDGNIFSASMVYGFSYNHGTDIIELRGKK